MPLTVHSENKPKNFIALQKASCIERLLFFAAVLFYVYYFGNFMEIIVTLYKKLSKLLNN